MPAPLLILRRPFVADHFHDLPGFQEARHGHNWEAEVAAPFENGRTEAALAEALDAWVRRLDYSLLNAHPELAGRNPTAEALAQWGLEALSRRLPVLRVKVREKANYWAACARSLD